MNNKMYLIALNRMQSVGPKTITSLLARWPNLEELFQESKQALLKAGLSERLITTILSFDVSSIEQDLRFMEAPNQAILSINEPKYPVALKQIYDPPPVLYILGNLQALNEPSIAIIGSRNPSVTGYENAHRFARELSSNHLVIVSGLALGIDAEAHRGCLDVDGRTVAVLGSSLDKIYPLRHQALAEAIGKNGAVLSEFPLGTSPRPGHFPRRNRIISGLSLATLVVEATMRSGSLITARLALEQNRDVFAIPGSIYNPFAKGCHHLIQQGAKLVTSYEDILNELNFEQCAYYNPQPMNEHLASCDENLVKFMGFEITTVDELIERSGFCIDKVICELAELEVAGIIKAVPGGYMRCVL